MKKAIIEGSRKGRCNICGRLCTLTKDHVPPKGSIDPRKVGIRTLIQTMDSVDPRIAKISQNGVKFRTLCSQCNNTKLGKNFDPALNFFSQKVAKAVRSPIILPSKMAIQIEPQKVARAIIGHLLAVGVRDDMTLPPISAPMPDLMRTYFLDETMDFPSDLNLYFWVYLAERQVILRGIGLSGISSNSTIVGDFIKYFPVAFWLTHRAPEQVKEYLQDYEVPIRGHGLNDYCSLVIRTEKQNMFRPDWPEVPDDTQFALLSDSLCFIADKT